MRTMRTIVKLVLLPAVGGLCVGIALAAGLVDDCTLATRNSGAAGPGSESGNDPPAGRPDSGSKPAVSASRAAATVLR